MKKVFFGGGDFGYYNLPKRRKRKKTISFLFFLSFSCLLVGIGLRKLEPFVFAKSETEGWGAEPQSYATNLEKFFPAKVSAYEAILPGENLFYTLRRLSVPALDAERFVNAFAKETDLRNLRPKDIVKVEFVAKDAQLSELVVGDAWQKNAWPSAVELHAWQGEVPSKILRVEQSQNSEGGVEVGFALEQAQLHKKVELLNGYVENSVYSSILASGGDASLVNEFSDIFAWQFDFYRESRRGDGFKIIVESLSVDGRRFGFGEVLAAEYERGNRVMRAFRFDSKDGIFSGFFDEKGDSLRNAFLKAPLKLANITSRYGMRFHPVQKRYKPHNGVDYGANRGTPFMAVASGKVINAGFNRFNGNWVRLRHLNGYETEYLHATKLAKGIRVGARVEQGQVIGYVGKTGLASGYHLHFGMKKHGNYVNPAKQRFAKSAGIPKKYLNEFTNKIAPLLVALGQGIDGENELVASAGE